MITSNKHNVYLLRSVFFIVEFIYFIFTSCTTHSTHLFRRGTVWSTSLHSGTRQDDHRLGGQTTYRRTSPPTNWSDCLALTPAQHSLCRRLVGWTAHRMGFIVSYVGGLPVTLGTHRCSDSSCKHRQLSWGLPWWSDLATSHQCAFKLLHAIQIRVLILGSTFGPLIST